MKLGQIRGYAAVLQGVVRQCQNGSTVELDITSAKAILNILVALTDGFNKAKERPSGFRWCGEPKDVREKSVLVDYYGHPLWLPKTAVVLVGGEVTAPLWVIESAKEYNALRDADSATSN